MEGVDSRSAALAFINNKCIGCPAPRAKAGKGASIKKGEVWGIGQFTLLFWPIKHVVEHLASG